MSELEHKAATANQGTGHKAEELLPLVYEELHRLASSKLAHERPGQTLQSTALVHEVWLHLQDSNRTTWEDRTHFFAAAAAVMRRILVDKARHRQRLKHGGNYERIDVDAAELAAPMPDEDLLALDEALTQLVAVDPEAAELVNLRFFTGLTQAQAAKHLGISRSTADRTWVFARAWLYERIRLSDLPGDEKHSARKQI